MHEPEPVPTCTLTRSRACSACLVLHLTRVWTGVQIDRHLNFVTVCEKQAKNMADIQQSKDVDVLINVRPFIVHLSKTLPKLMVPGRDQCVDESGVLAQSRVPSRVRVAGVYPSCQQTQRAG